MMPEIMIITFIMLNQIKLKLLGLYDHSELGIEPIMDAIDRNAEHGNE
jgi:hypothetical protein